MLQFTHAQRPQIFSLQTQWFELPSGSWVRPMMQNLVPPNTSVQGDAREQLLLSVQGSSAKHKMTAQKWIIRKKNPHSDSA